MSTLTKIDIIAIIIIALLVILFVLVDEPKTTKPVAPMTEEQLDVAFEEAYQYHKEQGHLEETATVNPFDFDPFDLDSIDEFIERPNKDDNIVLGPGTAIPLPVPTNCVDTYMLEDISCADAAAVVKFRKALAAEEVERLKKQIEDLEKELHYETFGLTES